MFDLYDHAEFDDEIGWVDVERVETVEEKSTEVPARTLRSKASAVFSKPILVSSSSPEPSSDFEILPDYQPYIRKRRFNMTPDMKQTNKARFQYSRSITPRRQTPSPISRTLAPSPAPQRSLRPPSSYSYLPRQSSISIDAGPSRQARAVASSSRSKDLVNDLSSSVEAIALAGEGVRKSYISSGSDGARASIEMATMVEQEEVSGVGAMGEGDGVKTTEDIINEHLQYYRMTIEKTIVEAISNQANIPTSSIAAYFDYIRDWEPEDTEETETRRMVDERLKEYESLLEGDGLWWGAAMPTGTYSAPICLEQAWPTSLRSVSIPNIMLVAQLYTPRTLLHKAFKPIDPRVYAYDIIEPRQGANIDHQHLPRFRHDIVALVQQFHPDTSKKAQAKLQQAFAHSITHFRGGEFNRLAAQRLTVSTPGARQTTVKIPITVPAIPLFGLPSTTKDVEVTLLILNDELMHIIVPLRHASAPKYTMKSAETFNHGFIADVFYNLALQLLGRLTTDKQMSVYSRASMPTLFEGEVDGGQQAMQAWMQRMGDRLKDVTAETLPARFKSTFVDLQIDIYSIIPAPGKTFAATAYGKIMSHVRLTTTTAAQRSAAADQAYLTRMSDVEGYEKMRGKMSTTRLKPSIQKAAVDRGKKYSMAAAHAARDLANATFGRPMGGNNNRGLQTAYLVIYNDDKPAIHVTGTHLAPTFSVNPRLHGQFLTSKEMDSAESIFTGKIGKLHVAGTARHLEFWFCDRRQRFFFRYTVRDDDDMIYLYNSTKPPSCAICKDSLIDPSTQCRPCEAYPGLKYYNAPHPGKAAVVHDVERPAQGTIDNTDYPLVCRRINMDRPEGKGIILDPGVKRSRKTDAKKTKTNKSRRKARSDDD